MTDEVIMLRMLVEKTLGADLLRAIVGFAAQRRMELEVEGPTGAGYGKKSSERRVQRTGYRDRGWETRAGTIGLRIPSCAGDPASQPLWCRAGWPRRRSPP
jgi:putative transposase